MNFLGIGAGELLLVLLIILLVVGPERLPQLARQWAKVTKTVAQFTRTWQRLNAEINRQLRLEELEGQQPQPAAQPAPASRPAAPQTVERSIAPPNLVQPPPAPAGPAGPAGPPGPAGSRRSRRFRRPRQPRRYGQHPVRRGRSSAAGRAASAAEEGGHE